MRQMRKTGYYTAFIGLFMAAALTVTACGASAKAPDVSSVVGGSETAADSAVGFQKIDTADKGNSGDTAAAGSGPGRHSP